MHQQLTLFPVPPVRCAECRQVAEDPIQAVLAGFVGSADSEPEVVWICREHWHDFPGDFVRAR